MQINGYKVKGELQNANSGFSKWGFCEKNGREYFIKELINPVYPIDKDIMTEEMFNEQRRFCESYENKFKAYFAEINRVSNGNLIRINEFIRYGSRYYLITEKVDGEFLSVEQIAAVSEDKKLLLLKTVAHCINDLHSAGIVHFDIKQANVLVKKTKNGNYAAKLIDFDSGFFKTDIPENGEIGGDLTYLAPETFLAIYGEAVVPDEKADIFSLGLLFHEYYCGRLPYFNETKYEYPYEAVLDGGVIMTDMTVIPEKLSSLISSMLSKEPEKRPSAREIITILNMFNKAYEEDITEVNTGKDESWFKPAGDL